MNYERDIRIDETALDVEWLEQPTLMLKYVRNAAQARMQLDLAKEKLDTVRAEVDRDIRTAPGDYKLVKVTDASVMSTILGVKRYQMANEEYLKAKFESDIAQGAVRAFEQRKDALENLVRLHGQSYFAGPRVPHDLSALRAAQQEEANNIVKAKLQRRAP